MDLFDPEAPTEIPLPGGKLLFMAQLDAGNPDDLLAQLQRDTPWQQEQVTLFGKTHPQPRLTAWYGDPDSHYSYSGLLQTPLPWTALLKRLRSAVENATGNTFNSVLLNYYRDEQDSMGLHADDEPELGPQPVIASLSLGAERTLYFKHKTRKDLRPLRLPLPSGSLLVMAGDTQKHWKHGIRKLSRPCGPRINLTFRWVYSAPGGMD